jgi:Icc-related predicted phosphoesterase
MKLLYATDLHGNRDAYVRLLDEAARRACDVVVLGGDLLPHVGKFQGSVAEQLDFLESFLVPLARQFRSRHPSIDLLWLLGNDDWGSAERVLQRLDAEGVATYLHGRVVEAKGRRWAGLSYVPITPFSIKDWERFDVAGQPVPPQFARAVLSRGDAFVSADIEADLRPRPTVEQELAALDAGGRLADAIWVVHTTPHDTGLDLTSRGEHVGSRALRAAIESLRPPLTLHGHIHESPAMSGRILERIGPTVCINPGDSKARLSAVVLDPDAPGAEPERVG